MFGLVNKFFGGMLIFGLFGFIVIIINNFGFGISENFMKDVEVQFLLDDIVSVLWFSFKVDFFIVLLWVNDVSIM